MLLPIIFFAVAVVVSGTLSAVFHKSRGFGRYFAAAANAVVSIVLLIVLICSFNSSGGESIKTGWPLPMGELSLGVDILSLFFMIPLLILTAACSVYGAQYFKKDRAGRLHWLFYGLLVAGMVMVLISRNAVVFMIFWEIMSFSSFLLVISDAEKEAVRRAGWIYFTTAHIGTAFLFATFFLLGGGAGSFDFELFGAIPFTAAGSNMIFITALIGFGLKAGFIPFHIWLPLAHPAAPSHVSGLMSGIMIKMGIYGILRVLTIITPLQSWWGILLVLIGAVSGILGVLLAAGQHDIKRMLAYSSVENIGIILIGLGIGITGSACGYPLVSAFGFAGALLHILNHALFKGLLFLGAGAVIRQTGSGEMDQLGGLLKKMPATGILFLAGTLAITGLPFFNGFISEILIYAAAVTGAVSTDGAVMPMLAGIAVLSLALTGGLAAVCFTKVFGTVFLGEARTAGMTEPEKTPALMKTGMIFLSVFILFIGMLGFIAVPLLEKPLLLLSAGSSAPFFGRISELSREISIILSVILAVILPGFIAGRFFFRRKTVKGLPIWGCGYSRPRASMQYTASSYSAPVTGRFGQALGLKKDLSSDDDMFPEKPWSFKSQVADRFLHLSERLVKVFDRILSLLRWFQCGRAGVYVLYIGLAVIILLIWKFAL